MAITKGKKIRRKAVRRGGGKSGASATRVRNKRPAKGKVYRLKPKPNSRSRSVQVLEATRPVAERSRKRSSGSWDTQKWLIGKKLAHVVKEKLIADCRKGYAAESKQEARTQRRRR